jgi:hypothetical protein
MSLLADPDNTSIRSRAKGPRLTLSVALRRGRSLPHVTSTLTKVRAMRSLAEQ